MLRSWLIWVTLGESIGFAIPAAVGALTYASPTWVALPALLLAGAAEGAVLGSAQAKVLAAAVPALSRPRWVVVTSAAAVLAWLVGMTFSLAGENAPGALLVIWVVLGGGVLLLSIGVAQWTVLRRHLPRAWRWIIFNALAWLAGLSVFTLISTPLWRQGQPVVLTAAIGLLAGVAMAATMALVTGLGLRSMLRDRSPGRLA